MRIPQGLNILHILEEYLRWLKIVDLVHLFVQDLEKFVLNIFIVVIRLKDVIFGSDNTQVAAKEIQLIQLHGLQIHLRLVYLMMVDVNLVKQLVVVEESELA